MTWGVEKYGGNSCAVQKQLKQVRELQSTTGAFAALLEDWFAVQNIQNETTILIKARIVSKMVSHAIMVKLKEF